MTLALTFDHYRVAAACTFGATASVIQRSVFGVTSGLPEKFYTSRLINDLRAARLLQQTADGHYWLVGEEDDHFREVTNMMPAVHRGPAPEAKPLGGHVAPVPDPVPLVVKALVVSDDCPVRRHPITTGLAARDFLVNEGYEVQEAGRGLWIIDGDQRLSTGEIVRRAEGVRERAYRKWLRQRKAA